MDNFNNFFKIKNQFYNEKNKLDKVKIYLNKFPENILNSESLFPYILIKTQNQNNKLNPKVTFICGIYNENSKKSGLNHIKKLEKIIYESIVFKNYWTNIKIKKEDISLDTYPYFFGFIQGDFSTGGE